MKKKGLPESANHTISRRSLLEWLGKATVLGLGTEVVMACTRSAGAGGPSVDSGTDPSTENDAADAQDALDPGPDAEPGEFPFSPGDTSTLDVFDSWGERTVDPQDLAQILASWTLRVDGMVESARTYTFAQLTQLLRQDQVTDFHCVEGWSVHDVPWNGVHLSTLFDLAVLQSGVTHVTFHTLGDRYNESLPLEVALEPKTMLAYGIGGYTIPLEHGFPLRLVVPRLLAYKSAKFVYRIELTDHPIEGFWVAAGYPYDAEVPESRLRPGKY